MLNRRDFLVTVAASGLALPFAARSVRADDPPARYPYGVASGDPLADRVILWTRIEASRPTDVAWRVARDERMTQVVARGEVRASADRDFTVKVDAGGLQPAATYYYAFEAEGERSPVGRTRTLPAADATRLRLAVVSCSNYPYGFFNVYGRLAARDLDAVIHLGDYIYEFENGRYGDGTALQRLPRPARETVSLDDYRQRYATYRSDPDLQEAHRQHPFIVTWDDHELANNAWAGGAENHNPERGEGEWAARRAAAYRAWREWMPVREAEGSEPRLYRAFRFGGLADLVMLDTRGLRDRQVAADDLAGLVHPSRGVLGAAQEAWMFDQLRASQRADVRWRLLGQQVMFARMSPPGGAVRNADSWDGYQAARARVLDFLEQERLGDVVILTGDVHSSWAMDVPRTPWDGYSSRTGAGSLAVELTTPAISSPPIFRDGQGRERAAALRVALPHLRFMDGEHRGYVLLDVTAAQVQADYFFVPTVTERSDAESRAARLVSEAGSHRLLLDA